MPFSMLATPIPPKPGALPPPPPIVTDHSAVGNVLDQSMDEFLKTSIDAVRLHTPNNARRSTPFSTDHLTT